MKRLIVSLIMCLILTGCFIIPEPPDPEPNKPVYRAFLVGVGDYILFSDLKSPSYNVERMRKMLSNCRFTKEEIGFTKINTLVDWDATKEATLEGITTTFAGADDNDVSYFYWNGHGGASIEPHIGPSDIDPQNMKETWISVHELEKRLSAVPGTKVVILDTCFSGGFIGRGFKDLLISDDFQVITSSRGSEVSYEIDWVPEPYAYFTWAVYRGCRKDMLADKNEDGIVNLKELHEYVQGYSPYVSGTQYYPRQSIFPIVEY